MNSLIVREERFKSFFKLLENVQNVKFVDVEAENIGNNIDVALDEIIIEIKESNRDIVFISSIIDSTMALSYLGARIAMHICVDSDDDFSNLPIVLLGVEPLENFLRNSEYGSLMLLPNVFYINYSTAAIERFLKEKKLKITTRTIDDIKKLAIRPPSNYNSHHSVDNEYALLRWSEYIGCNLPGDIGNKLKTGLYFKWLEKMKPIDKVSNPSKPDTNEYRGMVLLIDDEAENKWDVFYKFLFRGIDIKYGFLQWDRGESCKEVVTKKVLQFDPDVVLLDLRLQDSDFKDGVRPMEYTGYEVLKYIKEINKGIQVLITTASNKVWNYQALQGIGANGYVVKSRFTNVVKDIDNLNTLVKTSLGKGNVLKGWYGKIEKLKGDLNLVDSGFEKGSKANLDIAFKLLEDSFTEEEYKRYAYLQLYLIIEEFSKQKWVWLDENGEGYVVDHNGEDKLVFSKKPSSEKGYVKSEIKYREKGKFIIKPCIMEKTRTKGSNYVISAILFFRYDGDKISIWHEINNKRNDVAHKKDVAHRNDEKVNDDDINKILDFIEFILRPKDLNQNEIFERIGDMDFEN